MQESTKRNARPRVGRALGALAAALFCVAALSQPRPAAAEMHGGGGFHGGGFRGGGFRGGGFHHGRFFGGFAGFGFSPYYWDYGYGDYYAQPYSQVWYYCVDPAGYYPYVTQCNTGWQPVPAS